MRGDSAPLPSSAPLLGTRGPGEGRGDAGGCGELLARCGRPPDEEAGRDFLEDDEPGRDPADSGRIGEGNILGGAVWPSGRTCTCFRVRV